MGTSNSKNDSETINWNNIKTENVSSSMPNLNNLSKEAKQLIASLNIPEITESQTSEFTVNHILDTINTNLNKEDKQKFSSILDQVSSQTNSDDLSSTSPFISSEMYDYLVNSKTSEDKKQVGGAKSSKSKSKSKSKSASKSYKSSKSKSMKSKKGGSFEDNDSDTSSTSSDSELEDILDSTEEEILKEKKEKKEKGKDKKNKKHMKEDSDSEMSGGELSYLSSSAHTDGDFSQSGSESEASVSKTSHTSVESDSDNESSVNNNSVTDENKDMLTTSVSVNTDDINMVSDY
jgi:hypothetical protein